MSEESYDNGQNQRYAYRLSIPPLNSVTALLTQTEADELEDTGYAVSFIGSPGRETPTQPMQANWGHWFKAAWFRLRHTLTRGPCICGAPSWNHPYQAWFCSQCGGVITSSPAYSWPTA